jgi:hypothetical protein
MIHCDTVPYPNDGKKDGAYSVTIHSNLHTTKLSFTHFGSTPLSPIEQKLWGESIKTNYLIKSKNNLIKKSFDYNNMTERTFLFSLRFQMKNQDTS